MHAARICHALALLGAGLAIGGFVIYLATLRSESLAYSVMAALAIPIGGAIMLIGALAGWLLERQADTKV